MFVYLLIGLELALVYAVFWYVFVREPKPYKVQGKLWGSYKSTIEHGTKGPNHFQSELDFLIDSVIMDARLKAIDHLGFERRVPRPAFPDPLSLSSSHLSNSYDPSLYSKPSSHCTPGIDRNSHANPGQTNNPSNSHDPRDPYLDYPETTAPVHPVASETKAHEKVLNKLFNRTLCWFEKISVKRP